MRFISYSILCFFSLLLGNFTGVWGDCHCTQEQHCGCMTGGECSCPGGRGGCPVARSGAAEPVHVGYAPSAGYCSTPAPVSGGNYTYSPSNEIYDCYNQFCDDYSYNWSGYEGYDGCCGYDNGDCSEAWINAYYNDMPCPRYVSPTFEACEERGCWPCCLTGGWMPERPPLFRPFIADPRQLTYSVGWRFNDQALTKNVIDVSYWDSFPVYGWCNAWCCGDKLQINLEGCLWAVFDPCTYSSPLINADYYVGFHIEYALNNWSHRMRVFHISSHVGDEFLLNHPHFDRRNPSAEYFDYFLSYQWGNDIRLYGGLGWVLEQDHSFCTGRFYSEGGVEARITSLGCYDTWNHIYRVPFVAVHFRYRRDFERHLDATYALGIEIGKTNGLARRLRAYIEYHDGYSVEGQWSRTPTNYFSIRASYGF